MKKQNLIKMMVKAITAIILNILTGVTVTIDDVTTSLRTVVSSAIKASKANVADTVTEIADALNEAIRNATLVLNADDATIATLEAAKVSVLENLANAKNLILNAASARVTYEGVWTLNARIEVIDDDLANATSSTRYTEAKAALTAAGLSIPAAGAKRSEWRNLTDAAVKAASADAAKAEALRQAIACVRGALEDVVAGTAGKVKCVAKPFGKAITRKLNGQDVRLLVLPAKKYYFYADAAKAPASRQAANIVELELDEKGRLVSKDAVTIQ